MGGGNKPQKKPSNETAAPTPEIKGSINFTYAVPARVEEVIGRTGTREKQHK